MTGPVDVSVDAQADVLYAKYRDAMIRTSREAEHDAFLVINLDAQERIVGVQILGTHEIHWFEHPDRGVLPEEIRSQLDTWFRAHR